MQEMDESAIDSADTVGASLTDLENPLIFSIKNRVLNLDELLRHESITNKHVTQCEIRGGRLYLYWEYDEEDG
jgi:hypothetical protein